MAGISHAIQHLQSTVPIKFGVSPVGDAAESFVDIIGRWLIGEGGPSNCAGLSFYVRLIDLRHHLHIRAATPRQLAFRLDG